MIKRKIDSLIRKFYLHKNEDLPSFLIHSLYHQGSYLPYTTSSLKFRFMACMINDIVVNKRKSVLEFGTGISTIMIARLIKLNKLDCKVISVDESSPWQDVIKNILESEDLISNVELVCAPTQKSNDLIQSYEYDNIIINEKIGDRKFDFVLIDGPSAWQKTNIMSRASNIKFIKNNMAENFTIFVDNSDRVGETELTKRISYEFKLNPTKLDPTFISFSKGKQFNFVI